MSKTNWHELNEKQEVISPARGHIQWKGTNVCMDVECVCGEWGHIDGDFAYFMTCARCGRAYMVNPYVKLIEIAPDEMGDDETPYLIDDDTW